MMVKFRRTDMDRDTDESPSKTDGDKQVAAVGDFDIEEFLATVGFEEESNVLTRRQVKVLALRERGFKQETIADQLGTSRANVSGIETSARENVSKARETVRIMDLLAAPVQVEISANSDLYDVPYRVFDACDDAGVKVNEDAPELIRRISDAVGDAVEGREVRDQFVVTVTGDGDVWVTGPDVGLAATPANH
ncbi:MAG: Tfx family DNA-binding protein [Haloarculaceae archaeon]|jgi:Tfx family DNA-binding protein